MHETSFCLRRGRLEDADAIRSLTREAYAKWVPVIGREPLPMTVDYAAALRLHRFDVLCVETSVAGLIETVPKADHLLIENIAVSPSFQGRGFGRRLLVLAEEIARAANYVEIKLYTNKLFAENVSLYQRRSYQIDREETWTGGIIVHMTKRLPDATLSLAHSTA